jgi:L-asparaginase/Glu-tRNA(Gln) amidotransferase subunit D
LIFTATGAEMANKIGHLSDYLNGQKARIKLMLALGITNDHEKLKKLFN